jgi:hypothetical protein
MRSAKRDIAAVSTLVLTSYLAPTLAAAASNVTELSLGFGGALVLSLLTALVFWAVGCSFLLLLPRATPARLWLRSGLILLSAVCVANSSVFLWNFGLFDGQPVVLRDHVLETLAEAAFSGVALALLIRFRRSIDERIVGISAVLTLIAFAPALEQVGAVPEAMRVYAARGSLAFDLGDEKLLSFSRRQNVLVFVVDALETKNLIQSLKNSPALAKGLSGFTVFRNNAGVAPNTTYGVPAMISGIPYTGDKPSEEYRATALLAPTSLPVVLRRHGYDVRLFTQHSIPYEPGITAWDNVEEKGRRAAAVAGWLSLTRLAVYRVAPTPLKLSLRDEERFARVQAWIVREVGAGKAPLARRFDDAGLLSRLARDSRPSLSRPAFRWFHLQGVHQPLTLVPPAEQSRSGMSGPQLSQLQADRLLERLAEMLQALRALGIYDTATIAIVGDHGLFDTRMPALMIKPTGANTVLTSSEAPTSNTDLSSTILAQVGIPTPDAGADVFALDPDAPRERFFYEFYSIDRMTDRPKEIVTQALRSRQNAATNWSLQAPRHPAFQGRETNTRFMSFAGNADIDRRKVRGKYSRHAPGILWSGWLEVDVAAPAGTPALADLLYYRYGRGPEQVAVSVDGAGRGEFSTSPFGSFRLFLPAKSAPGGGDTHTTLRFSFESSLAANETLLFVDLVSTWLSGESPSPLRPAVTGLNCDLNAVWGTGGEFWGAKRRLLALAGTRLYDMTVNEAKQVYSFVVPAGTLASPFPYRLLDASAGILGPEVTPAATCPGS